MGERRERETKREEMGWERKEEEGDVERRGKGSGGMGEGRHSGEGGRKGAKKRRGGGRQRERNTVKHTEKQEEEEKDVETWRHIQKAGGTKIDTEHVRT